jgi:hypothetical protein
VRGVASYHVVGGRYETDSGTGRGAQCGRQKTVRLEGSKVMEMEFADVVFITLAFVVGICIGSIKS